MCFAAAMTVATIAVTTVTTTVATTATVAGTGTGTESVTTIAATTVAALARARAKATQYQVVHRRLAIVSRSAGVATNSTKCKKTTVMSWAVAQRAGSLCAVSVINMCSDRKAASPDGLAANRGLPDTAQHSTAQLNATQRNKRNTQPLLLSTVKRPSSGRDTKSSACVYAKRLWPLALGTRHRGTFPRHMGAFITSLLAPCFCAAAYVVRPPEGLLGVPFVWALGLIAS